MGRLAQEMVGKVFGNLSVIEKDTVTDKFGHRTLWICRCVCGIVKSLPGGKIRSGELKSCGCLRKEQLRTHGQADTDEYRIWRHVKGRTRSLTNNSYPDYGGRGITMSDEWFDSFETFYKDMGPRPSKEHSIERIENNKGYFKGNCKWATRTEQANNRRSSALYSYIGKTKTLADWCRELNLDPQLISCRINQLKWTFEKAITTTVNETYLRLTEYLGVIKPLKQWCSELGVAYLLISRRMYYGLLFEVAIKIDELNRKGSFELDGVSKTIKQWCKDSYISFPIFKARLYKGWTLEEALSDIASRQINFNPCDDGKPPDTQTLEFWCGLLSLDKDTTYLRILRGESFESIVAE